jgi:hypothetical protein
MVKGQVKLPLLRVATESPAANRERSSDDIHVVGRVRASALRWMCAPSPDARGLASTSPEGRGIQRSSN